MVKNHLFKTSVKIITALIVLICCLTTGVRAQSGCTISGPDSVCLGAGSVHLTTSGCGSGSWSSTNSTIATVSATGDVTGLVVGVPVYISYGSASVLFMVNTVPTLPAITGAGAVCAGANTTLANGYGGGTWTTSDATVASVSTSGSVHGVAGGTATITYTATNTCGASYVTKSIRVDAAIAHPIFTTSGVANYCYTVLDTGCVYPYAVSGGVPAGVTPLWTMSSSLGVINGSTGCIHLYNLCSSAVTGTVQLKFTNSCGADSTSNMINLYPENRITSSSSLMCPGSFYTFADCGDNGIWHSSDTSIVQIDSVSGIATASSIDTGVTVISFTNLNHCTGALQTKTVTVKVGWATSLSLVSPICAGAGNSVHATASPSYSGGIWHSSSTAIASVTPYAPTVSYVGVVTGVGTGTAYISYTCGAVVSASIAVSVAPSVTPILPTGIGSSVNICTGGTYSLSDATSGGTWSCSPTTVVSVDGSGTVYGLSTDSTGISNATITYTVSSGGCSTSVTKPVTIYSSPYGGTIYGATVVCTGHTITLHDTTATHVAGVFGLSGIWSSSNPAVASIDGSGVVYGVASGTVTITYTVTRTGGYSSCPPSSAYYTVTVNPPLPAITGTTAICQGGATTLHDGVSGGYWISSNTSVATVDYTSGLVTASPTTVTSIQTVTIYYTANTGCAYQTVSTTVTVNPNPVIIGTLFLCQNANTTLTATVPGGTWSTSNAAIASINGLGVVTGVAAGTATISYIAPTGCQTSVTFTVWGAPVITTTPYPIVACGTSVQMSASGALSYTWAGTPAVSFATTSGSSVFASPVSSIPFVGGVYVYTVTGIGTNGCPGIGYDTVVQPACDGYFCSDFGSGTAPIYALSGTIGSAGTTTVFLGSAYLVNADLYLDGNVTFSPGCVVAVAPGKSIYVKPTGALSINNSHFLCCSRTDMWHGIILNSNTKNTGTVNVYNNSMIEDAKKGIKLVGGIAPTTGNIITSNGCVYNRDSIGISIESYTGGSGAHALPFNMQFLIRNSIFTSRDMSVLNTGGPLHYPLLWPYIYGTPTALKSIWGSGTAVIPSFNILSPTGAGIHTGGYGGRYNPILCKNGAAAVIGVQLLNTGAATGTATAIAPATYSRVVIGDNSSYSFADTAQNVFDTLQEGIYAQSSNFVAYNNLFMYMYQPATMLPFPNLYGDGIGAASNLPASASLPNPYSKYSMEVSGSTSSATTNNLFYDCHRGVSCYNYFDIIGTGAQMYSRHTATYNTGQFGYFINSPLYENVNLSNNFIYNNITGISMNTATLPSSVASPVYQYAGQMAINNNTIESDLTGGVPTAAEYVQQGIMVTNSFLSGTATSAYYAGSAQTKFNILNYVYNGINVNGYHTGQVMNSDSNTIIVNNYTTSTANQNGISHQNCSGSTITGNSITGPGYNVPAAGTTPTTASKISGVYGAGNTNMVVSCNYSGHINIGYYFTGGNPFTKWINNEMNQNTYGLVLKGSFGNQGSPTLATNNVWKTPSWWTGGIRTIMTLNGAAPVDNIYISSGTSGSYLFDPSNNENNPSVPANRYGMGGGSGNGLFPLGGAAATPDCLHPYVGYLKPAGIATGPYTESMAQNWIAQNGLWQMIQLDTTFTDSSVALQDFATKAVASRYGWLSNIEAAIMSGDEVTANALMSMDKDIYVDTTTDTTTGVAMQDGVDADYIIGNYLTFYHTYLNYKDSVMTVDDSAQIVALANLCPYTNGNVVYMAQALYRVIYEDDTTSFDNNCGTDTSSGNRKASIVTANLLQQYKLYPNPNDGSFKLLQSVADTNPVSVTIKDMLGRSVFTQSAQFVNGSAQLQLDKLTTGIYLLQIADANQKISNFKFVVQK